MHRLTGLLILMTGSLLLAACDSDSADETARELTGSNLVKQEKALKQKLDVIQAQQQQRLNNLEQQDQQEGQ